ncbi:MAG TPA: AcrB/AcrD/AcrF family protein [Rhodospirillaceae bacterium]|nr:acriflavin resistance protein [Rhodospirillaceae bacterium]HAT35270.1 AcrB/AcrD/AcrF family protein [Rhodospirillaceae bacterium]
MDLIQLAIKRPMAVIAAVIVIILFGIAALYSIPIQLSPDVAKPVITIRTHWPGAAPAEVEREIVNEQEEELAGLPGLSRITSRAETARGRIELEFEIGTNMDKAMLLVSNRLDRVRGYPDEALEPRIRRSGEDDDRIAWFHITKAAGNDTPIHHYGDFAENVLRDRLERVPGVGTVGVRGGGTREMRVIIHAEKMAQYGLTVPEILQKMRRANVSITAGDVEEGKRRYVVRTEGEFRGIQRVRSVVLRAERDNRTGRTARVLVSDIADVKYGYSTPVHRIRTNGQPAMAMFATREAGSNIVETMKGVRKAVKELAEGAAKQEGLVFRQLYDETVYIDSAISLVVQNIWIGGAFAVGILLLFLRSGRATLVIGIAIPVSVVSAFVAMALLGRSINVVSLAGIAFAVGMVVDAAIVVLENIYRLRQRGESASVSALLGARQVWGAIMVSVLTTVAVFIPLLLMERTAGQIFRDIAVAISVAVTLSLIVSVTVIPALANRLLVRGVADSKSGYRLPVVDAFGRWFVAAVVRLTKFIVSDRRRAFGLVAGITGLCGILTWALLPSLEYLPEGNQNLVIGYVYSPAGYNLKSITDMATRMENKIRPQWASETGPHAEPDEPPKLKYFFFLAFRQRTIIGARGIDPERARDMVPLLRDAVKNEPATKGTFRQSSIFGRRVGGTRSINIDVKGPVLEDISQVAQRISEVAEDYLPNVQVRARPRIEVGEPEIRVLPDPIRLADNGLTTQDLALSVDAFNDGVRVAEINVGGEIVDLMLMGPEADIGATQAIQNLPVVTSSGKILPVSSLADVKVTTGPTAIWHRERQRAITLRIRPDNTVALGDAIDIVRDKILPQVVSEGLPPGIRFQLTGTAKELDATAAELKWDLILALAIVFLVMAVLFESFIYPLIIVFSVPLATAGGVIGLTILRLFDSEQRLDMLTILGFVILIGIVVNNAILIVHQALHHFREEGMGHQEAVMEATRNRIRPIFMSTLTSVFGMVPLVLFPGAGSEIYRGLGSVVVGGLSLSAILTLAIVPPLLSIVISTVETSRDARLARKQIPQQQGGLAE